MANLTASEDRRVLLEHHLTQLGLYAKQLCPEAEVELLTTSYEGEDGHVRVHVPSSISEKEIVRLENKLADKSTKILVTTGLSVLAGVIDNASLPPI